MEAMVGGGLNEIIDITKTVAVKSSELGSSGS